MEKQETNNIIVDLIKALLSVSWVALVLLPLAISLILGPLGIEVGYWERVVMSMGLCIILSSLKLLY